MEDQMRGQPVGDDQRNYLRNQTWNDLVNDRIYQKVYDKLGINVTGDELSELATGENASQYIRNDQQFKNPQTGQFDPAQVRLYLNNLDRDPEGRTVGHLPARYRPAPLDGFDRGRQGRRRRGRPTRRGRRSWR